MHGEFPAPTEHTRPSSDWLHSHAHYTVTMQGDPVPDLSLIRGEWYFTSVTANGIATRSGESVLAVGTPTIAHAVARQALGKEVELVDSSPWVTSRNQEGLEFAHHCMDFANYVPAKDFDSVVVDPPWYEPMYTDWVRQCSKFVRPSGRLFFPLMGPSTRPTAPQERHRILELAASLGTVSIDSNCVVYDTPRYERCALWARGVVLSEPWRRADLIEVRVTNPARGEGVAKSTPTAWREYRVGSTLVAVRDSPTSTSPSPGKHLLGEIDGVRHRTLDTVSRRDSRWRDVDVWFSNNRVARCLDKVRLHAVLSTLGEQECRSEGDTELTADAADLNELEEWIHG